MEYILRNKKVDVYVGETDVFEHLKGNAKMFKRKEANEKLKTLPTREDWEMLVVRDGDELTEDEKIMNIIHENHIKEYDKIFKKYCKERRDTNIFFAISVMFFLFSLGYFTWVIINYVR